MHNVTEINATNEINETLVKISRCLPRSRKPYAELIDFDGGYLLREVSNKYDLSKFIQSLTDEELTWEKDVSITGTIQTHFTDTPPEDIWDDEDALEEYMEYLCEQDLEGDEVYFEEKNLEIFYLPNLVVSPATVTKLEDAKFQMKEYLVRVKFEHDPSPYCENWQRALSPQDAFSINERYLYDQDISFSNLQIVDSREVA
jgi:hypothetical protein